jgi:hypothetical protein
MEKETILIGLTSMLIIIIILLSLSSSILFIKTLATEIKNENSTISFNKVIYDEITSKINTTLFESILSNNIFNNVSAINLSGSYMLLDDNLVYKIIKLTQEGDIYEIIINPLTGDILHTGKSKSNNNIFSYFSPMNSFLLDKFEDNSYFGFNFSNGVSNNFTTIDGSQIIPFQTGLHIADTAGIHDHPCIGKCKVLPNGDHEHYVKTTTE